MGLLKVAIVGAGPAGAYVAERLGKKAKAAVAVDVFDRLPTPFGLVRSGVAPDHQGLKAASRVMAKALEKPEVRFFGNVEIGRDLTLDDLGHAYDAVVLAVGASVDKRLGVSGDGAPGVIGAGAFTRWYNDHPDAAANAPDLRQTKRAIIIGNGNVAVDVARILAKQPGELEGSDLSPDVSAQLADAPIEEIVMVGRRGAAQAKFTASEIRELGELTGAHVIVDPADLGDVPEPENTDAVQSFEVLQELAAAPPQDKPVTIRLHFCLQPDAVLTGEGGAVSAMRFRRTQMQGARAVPIDEVVEIPTDLVIPCIGFDTRAPGDLAADGGPIQNQDGEISRGLFVVGWAKRGPSGTIATNRPEAHAIADQILDTVAPSDKPGRNAILPLLQAAKTTAIDWDGWGKIDAAEVARADTDRVRHKFNDIGAMIDVAT